MIRQDDRTEAQQETHQILVIGTDSFMSGWGEAKGGTSIAAWAVPDDGKSEREALEWVKRRGDMKRVRTTIDRPGMRYRPKGCAHLHIYVWTPR